MNSKKNKRNFEHGFTSMDNRIFYLQEQLTPNAFSIIIRLYRMTEGYDGKPKALANAYFQKTCNMSKNTVTKALKELEDLELIYTKRRPRVSTLYLINLEKVDDIFQQVRASIISEFDNNESQDMGNIDKDESQNMTQCFPKYDLDESQNMGTNKENFKENVIKENTTIVTEKSEADLLVDFWNDNRPPSAAVKKEVWSKIVKARLKTFSADEIKTAMLTVINSQWHQQNKQVLIKNAVDSDKRCAEAIEKSSQKSAGKKIDRDTDKLAVNQKWAGAHKSNIVAANTNVEDMFGASK